MTALWIVSGLLALLFLLSGGLKATQPKEKVKAFTGGWVDDFSDKQVKGIGILELLGAIGLLSPLVSSRLDWLAGFAAIGLAMTMIGAAYTHYRRGEMLNIVGNAVWMLLAIFIVYNRFFALG